MPVAPLYSLLCDVAQVTHILWTYLTKTLVAALPPAQDGRDELMIPCMASTLEGATR